MCSSLDAKYASGEGRLALMETGGKT